MKRFISHRFGRAGFTLAETMISLTVSASMFAAITYSTLALQKCFSASDDYSMATSDQQRTIDYICRDLRAALTVTIPTGGQTLSMTLPDYYTSYDAQGNPTGSRATPTITTGVVNYGNPTKPLTVTYFLSGQSIIRMVTVGATGATSQMVVSNDVSNFALNFVDLTSQITFNISFQPKFSAPYTPTTSQRQGTTISATVSVRNARRG
jgi:Tfp pilus assembly protein PilW